MTSAGLLGAAMAAAIAAVIVLAPSAPARSSAGSARASASSKSQGNLQPVSIVLDVDVTGSVDASWRRSAINAFAERVYSFANRPGGQLRLFVRWINASPDTFRGMGPEFDVDAAQPLADCGLEIGGGPCHRKNRLILQAEIDRHHQARAMKSGLETLKLPTAWHTRIAGAFAYAGDLLSTRYGQRWLIAITDLRPASAANLPPTPIHLQRAHVQVLVFCADSGHACRERSRYWNQRLLAAGALRSNQMMLQLEDADELLR